jgi:hypothetical protein
MSKPEANGDKQGNTTMTIKTFKNGAYVTFERNSFYGQYLVKVYSAAGNLIDKIITFDYRTACEYRRAFNAIAKNH